MCASLVCVLQYNSENLAVEIVYKLEMTFLRFNLLTV